MAVLIINLHITESPWVGSLRRIKASFPVSKKGITNKINCCWRRRESKTVQKTVDLCKCIFDSVPRVLYMRTSEERKKRSEFIAVRFFSSSDHQERPAAQKDILLLSWLIKKRQNRYMMTMMYGWGEQWDKWYRMQIGGN